MALLELSQAVDFVSFVRYQIAIMLLTCIRFHKILLILKWPYLFTIAAIFTLDIPSQSFQFLLINTSGISTDSPNCSLCKKNEAAILYLFDEC